MKTILDTGYKTIGDNMTKRELKQLASRWSHSDWGDICADARSFWPADITPEAALLICETIILERDGLLAGTK